MQNKKLYRSKTNRVFFGVCGGLGEFFGLDATLIRLIFVIGTLIGFGSFFIIYLAMWLIVPEEGGDSLIHSSSTTRPAGSATTYDIPPERPSEPPDSGTPVV